MFFTLSVFWQKVSKENAYIFQRCGSGSGRILFIFPDPDQLDPDRYQFQANDKVDKLYFLKQVISRKFQYSVQNTENFYTFDTDEKDAVTESKKIMIFQHL